MPTPTVSVVIPTRNRAHYLQECLGSVFAQTYTQYEILVVDDGSTDGTQSLLAPLEAQGAIRYFRREPAGVSAARNFGVQQSRGQYIAFLDSDDLFEPSKLQKQVSLFEANPHLGFVHCWFTKFNETGELGVRDTSVFRGQVYPSMLTEWSVLMAMPCLLVRRDVFLEVGGFDEHMRWAEDLDLWRRIARHYPLDLVPESLVRVRVHAASTSFDKTHSSQGFVHYMEKALAEDAALSPGFRRAAWAKLYTNLAQNLLGEGGGLQMQLARQHVRTALGYRALHWPAWGVWLTSWVPGGLRRGLAAAWRRLRYG